MTHNEMAMVLMVLLLSGHGAYSARIKMNAMTEPSGQREQADESMISTGLRARRQVQQAHAAATAVEQVQGELGEVSPQVIANEVNSQQAVPGVQMTPALVVSAQESSDQMHYFADTNTQFTRPEAVVDTARIPRPRGYSGRYPGHDASGQQRHEFMAHLDALLTEASFMEHAETKEEWEKHAVLCEQGFKFGRPGKKDKNADAHQYSLDEDITQNYEGDQSMREGALDGKAKLLVRHPGMTPPDIIEFRCENCLNEMEIRSKHLGGEDLRFVTSTPFTLEGQGIAQFTAPGLFSYSFEYDIPQGQFRVGFAGQGKLTPVLDGTTIREFTVAGVVEGPPEQMSPEKHQFHCEAAKLNRHSQVISILTPKSQKPKFPNFLGEFEVNALEHAEMEQEKGADVAFLKVTLRACGPCDHNVKEFNDKVAGLQEVNTGGEPCGARSIKSSDGCPDRLKADYGVWYVTTKKFDTEVLPMLQQVETEMEVANARHGSNASFGAEGENIYWDVQELLARIRDQEVRFPWNQKMERMDIFLTKCTFDGRRQVTCPKTGEMRYMHDNALMFDSGDRVLLDYVETSANPRVQVGRDQTALNGFQLQTYNAALKGGLTWEVSVAKTGACTPVMQEYFYVGVGMDSEGDLDTGIGLWQLKRSNGGRGPLELKMVDHLNFARLSGNPKPFAILAGSDGPTVQYSGDERKGAGEGDDEWMFLKLNELRQMGINYITVHVNIYELSGKSRPTFQDLEGAFVRFAEGSVDAEPQVFKKGGFGGTKEQNAFVEAHTTQYIDLDAHKDIKGSRAVLAAVLFLDHDSNVMLPKDTVKDLPVDAHYQLVTAAHGMNHRNAFNRTGLTELHEWWMSLAQTSKAEKVQHANQVTGYELGEQDGNVLAELPGAVDPGVMTLEGIDSLQDGRTVDQQVGYQVTRMGVTDKVIYEDLKSSKCLHCQNSECGEGAPVVLSSPCGVLGDAITFQYAERTASAQGMITQLHNNQYMYLMAPSGAEVIMSGATGSGDQWSLETTRTRQSEFSEAFVHVNTGKYLGSVDGRVVLVEKGDPNVVYLTAQLVIPGLFDNLLTEFPAGPPGADTLCLKPKRG